MGEWLVMHQAEALPPAVIFAAGAISLGVVQYVAIAVRRLLARRRAARTVAYAIRDPRRLRADADAANLETGVARLKQRTLKRVRELDQRTGEAQDLRRALAEKSAAIEALERAKADLELWQEKHVLDQHRQDDDLRARPDGLADAQRTIATLRGLLDLPERARASMPRRASR